MYTVQMVWTTSCSLKTACVVFENISHWRNDGQNVHSKDKGEGEEHTGPVCQSTRCHLLQMTSSHGPKWICQMNSFVCMSPKLLQLCTTLCDPLVCSSPDSSVEWIAILSPRGSSWPRDWTCSSAGRLFTTEPLGKPESVYTQCHIHISRRSWMQLISWKNCMRWPSYPMSSQVKCLVSL